MRGGLAAFTVCVKANIPVKAKLNFAICMHVAEIPFLENIMCDFHVLDILKANCEIK
jgi:hypothetical protein